MKIKFENLGPIQSVELDTSKKLNVIIGENGVGKTYLSIATYSLLLGRLGPFYTFINRDIIKKTLKHSQKEGKDTLELDYDLLLQNIEQYNQAQKNNYQKHIPNFVNYTFANGYNDNIFKDLAIEITIDIQDSIYQDLIDYIKTQAENIPEITIDNRFTTFYKPQKIEFTAENIDWNECIEEANSILCENILPNDIQKVLFLSAERAAINLFSKELAIKRNNLLDELLESSRKNNSNSTLQELLNKGKRYVVPIREQLEYANDIANISKDLGVFAELANEIEQEILHGTLTINQYEQIIFSPNNAKSKQTPLDIAASSVQVLAGFVLLLRHIAKKGITVFIDEPELNLHPNTQVKLARILVRMVNVGIKLVISTHSDYIIRELNNCIIANEIKDQEEYAAYHLDKNDIEITRLYKKSASAEYVTAEKVAIESDGFTAETIDTTIEEQNDLSIKLLKKLYDEE